MGDEAGDMTELEAWVGRRSSMVAVLDPGPANELAVTLDRDPAYRVGDALPPGWHWAYFHDLVRASDLGPDGHPRLGLTMPPLGLPRRMWAGGSLRFEGSLRCGEQAERVSTIRSITPKTGRSGPLCFVELEHEISVDGRTRLVERQSIVYRGAVGETAATPGTGADHSPEPAAPREPDASDQATHRLDATTLFRYSAVTFNGHRIHYDLDHARRVEGYPGLVIHGTLVATLLLDRCVAVARPLGWFRYRAVRPLCLPDPFTTHMSVDGDSTRLWATDASGAVAMEAEAGPVDPP